MKLKYVAGCAILTLLLLTTNVVHAQKGGGGHGGGGHGGGGHSGSGAHMHSGGNNHNHNGYYAPGFRIGVGFYAPLYGYGYSYPYSYGYGYDYPYIAPRVSYYPQTIIVQGDSAPVSTSASVRVLLPSPQARVFFDGNATKQEGTDRLFHTPSLTGSASYRVRAVWLENGKEVVQEAVATVRPGEPTTVDFTKASEELPIPK